MLDGGADDTGMRILIVDDSRVMRQIVSRTLRQAGFTGHDFIEASNGVEGLAAVASHDPDLVLADWDLPELNGIDMLATLRSRGDDVPFGFVTSASSPEVRSRADAAGAVCVLRKPITPERVREQLQAVLR